MNWRPYSNLGNHNGFGSGAWWGACGSELHHLNISLDSERATRLVKPFLRNGTFCHENAPTATSADERVAQMKSCAANANEDECSSAAGCTWCASKDERIATKCYEEREANVLTHVLNTERGDGHFVCKA